MPVPLPPRLQRERRLQRIWPGAFFRFHFVSVLLAIKSICRYPKLTTANWDTSPRLTSRSTLSFWPAVFIAWMN